MKERHVQSLDSGSPRGMFSHKTSGCQGLAMCCQSSLLLVDPCVQSKYAAVEVCVQRIMWQH